MRFGAPVVIAIQIAVATIVIVCDAVAIGSQRERHASAKRAVRSVLKLSPAGRLVSG
jgi:hypothetical protein